MNTYCTQTDVEAMLSEPMVRRLADDDQDGELSTAEEASVARAIEQAAGQMNAALELRYRLSDLAGNSWCRDANAILAAFLLASRRGNKPPPTLVQLRGAVLIDLADVRAGHLKIPGVADSFDVRPTVTNFDTDLHAPRRKVAPVTETSIPR